MTARTPDLASLPRGRGRVELRLQGRVAELVFDNPAARNALSIGMMLDLRAAVDKLRQWSGAVVILRSGDRCAFCSGGDLAAVRAHLLDAGLAEAMSSHMQGVLDELAALPLVRIAALEGAAVGGGAEVLLVADWVVASPASQVGFVQGRLGVSPGWGGGRRLVERLGPRRARLELALARTLSAEDALAVGLVDEVHGHADALGRARELAAELAGRAPEALAVALQVGGGLSLADERAAFLSLWGGPAHRTALALTRHGRAGG
jgi:enoyl-CoA hydratase/carnithine racemase